MDEEPRSRGTTDLSEVARQTRQVLLERAEQISHMGSWDLDRSTLEMVWSDNLFRIFGYEPQSFVPTIEFLSNLVHPEDREELDREVQRAVNEGEVKPFEYRVSRPDGQLRHIRASAILVEREGAEAGHIVGVARDLTEQRTVEEFRDVVVGTMAEGLYAMDVEGRFIFMNSAAERMLGWDESDLKGQLVHDTIHFQRADGSPYPEDECPILRVRENGRVARMGNEPFTCRDGKIIEVAYSAAPLNLGAGLSGVVVVFRDTTQERIEQDRVRRELDALTWVGRIRDAIDDKRLTLYSQTIVPLNGGPAREELLLRMISPGGEIIPPGSFLPTAERFGMISEIDEWVAREAVKLAASGRRVQANLSANSLGRTDFLSVIEDAIRQWEPDPSDLVFELTETSLLDNLAAGEAFARGLTRIGCGVALDDFGTGFGGFTYLKAMPIKFLKIDRDFVRELASNSASQYLVKAIVGLAQDFRCSTIAEGIESEESLELVRGLGIDYAQGYHLGRPVPLSEGSART